MSDRKLDITEKRANAADAREAALIVRAAARQGWRGLEFEEQCHARSLLTKGYLQWIPYHGESSVPACDDCHGTGTESTSGHNMICPACIGLGRRGK